jgi:bifunctional UDP-N-acetylglucosamine pyrophosphorylase/glucosamine-1-phosphate N-acetyltransferase
MKGTMQVSGKNMPKVQGIILAAGRGTRMKAIEKNKVMFEVGKTPMVAFPVRALKGIGVEKPIVVVGFAKESIKNFLQNTVTYAEQEKAEGTADAVRVALDLIDPEVEQVIVLYGDGAMFYSTEVLQKLLQHQLKTHAAMTLITTHTDPKGYGRILRGKNGAMIGIVEEKNATEVQREITEINTGNAVYSIEFLKKYMPMIQRNAVSGEFYFTDIVALGFEHKEKIETLVMDEPGIGIAVNTPEQLAIAEEEMKKRQQ